MVFELYLFGCQGVTNDAVSDLAGMRQLKQLFLFNCQAVSDEGLDLLVNSGLKAIWVNGTSVTPEGVLRVQQQMPKCKIIH